MHAPTHTAFSKIGLFALSALAALSIGSAARAGTCVGHCGVTIPHGVVEVVPQGVHFINYVSNYDAAADAGKLNSFGGIRGSMFASQGFNLDPGDRLSFFANFITTEGYNFYSPPDYAWATLQAPLTVGPNTPLPPPPANAVNPAVVLFTAQPSSLGPSFDAPGLVPGEADLIQKTSGFMGRPDFVGLGGDVCQTDGCGATGWFRVDYTATSGGEFYLGVGVTQTGDLREDAALAFADLTVNGVAIGEGFDPIHPVMPFGQDPNGAYEFEFQEGWGQGLYIDPAMARGYDYQVADGSPWILRAMFPTLAGDTDGYDVYALGDLSTLLAHVMGGETLDFAALGFAGGVNGFALRGIDAAAGLDVGDPNAFVTQLFFASSGEVRMTQTPVTGVPEPASWALMILGFFGLGGTLRTRRALAGVAAWRRQGRAPQPHQAAGGPRTSA